MKDNEYIFFKDGEEKSPKNAPQKLQEHKNSSAPSQVKKKAVQTKTDENIQNKPAGKPAGNMPKKRQVKSGTRNNKLLVQIGISVGTFFVLLIVFVVVFCNVLLNGPSVTIRDQLVLSAKQASATKWLPGLFMDSDTVDQIEKNSKTVYFDTVPISNTDTFENEDEWATAIDGIIFKTLSLPTCKAYMLIIKDPSRVFVGVSSDFKSGEMGARIFDIAEKYNAVCAINGGEFPDNGGVGTGSNPIGLTYSCGKNVWNDGITRRTFIGFDKDNVLHVEESMTEKRANELGIRDAVCFQTGNTLITNDGENITRHYANWDTGTAQRTAIGQRKDGAVIFLVTDGRTASSVGATHNDIVDTMVEYGAVTAAKLDGGSSALMYYRDYFNKYNYDLSTLDEYQKQGLVNKYKAFTNPRRIPTYFVVSGVN